MGFLRKLTQVEMNFNWKCLRIDTCKGRGGKDRRIGRKGEAGLPASLTEGSVTAAMPHSPQHQPRIKHRRDRGSLLRWSLLPRSSPPPKTPKKTGLTAHWTEQESHGCPSRVKKPRKWISGKGKHVWHIWIRRQNDNKTYTVGMRRFHSLWRLHRAPSQHRHGIETFSIKYLSCQVS